MSSLVEEHSGLKLEPDERGAFAERCAARAAETGFESLLDYYYFLRYDPRAPAELQRLIDDVVVGETYLFRELDALRVAVSEFIVPRVAAGRRPRIWSAACATGEEPATVAILLAQEGLLGAVDLVASDISERALARARLGRWSRRALRDVPSPALVARWMQEDPDGTPRVRPELLATIDFRRINLVDPVQVASVGPCDVVLCRNVLIYFSDETASKVVAGLAANLTHDGALFVGVSESLLRLGTALDCAEIDRTFFYRRPP